MENAMRRSCVVCFVFIALAAVSAPCASAAPAIQSRPEQLNFGEVREGTVAEGAFTVLNAGDAPLIIERIQSSCQCASVKGLETIEKEIAPGASLELPVQYDTTGRVGPQKAYVVVTSNDPAQPVLLLRMDLDIKVFVRIRPPAVRWGRAIRGEPLADTLKLSPGTTGQTFELTDIQVEDPNVTVTTESVTENGQPMIVARFTLKPETPLGGIDTTVKARVHIADQDYAVEVPLGGLVIGDVIWSPPLLAALRVPVYPGARISTFTLRPSRPERPIDVVQALTTGPIRAEVVREENECRVDVFAAKDAAAGPHACLVQLFTTSLDEPMISAPVYVLMAGPVAVTPGHLVFDMPQPEPGPSQTVQLRAIQSLTMKVQGVRAESERLQVEVETPEQTDPEHPAVLKVALRPNTGEETEVTAVVVETDQPGANAVRIPVFIRSSRSATPKKPE